MHTAMGDFMEDVMRACYWGIQQPKSAVHFEDIIATWSHGLPRKKQSGMKGSSMGQVWFATESQ